MRLLKIVAINLGLTLAILLAFDAAAYFLLPNDWNFNGYRLTDAALRTPVAGLLYPPGYFEPNSTRGFDIRPAVSGVAAMNNYFFPIEANEFGCRDRKISFEAGKPLIYAAGDSQTWGIVPIDERWTNLLEKKISVPILNCGVPGTAQTHQHQKYREVISKLERKPNLVIVTYISNDVFEDGHFPAYTVVDGFLTMNDASPQELERRVEAGIERLNHPSLYDRIKGSVKRYSLSSQIAIAFWKRAHDAYRGQQPDTVYDYTGTAADKNQQAIKQFAEDVCSAGIRFAVLIPPDSTHLKYPEYFADLDRFLSANGIFSVDFHRTASEQGLRYSDFSQFNDPHFSELGNKRYADDIDAIMKKDGDGFGSCKGLQRSH